MNKQAVLQIGKQGITDNFMMTINNALKTHLSLRITVLKSSGRDRESIIKMADEIISNANGKYGYRILGFTIIIKKQ